MTQIKKTLVLVPHPQAVRGTLLPVLCPLAFLFCTLTIVSQWPVGISASTIDCDPLEGRNRIFFICFSPIEHTGWIMNNRWPKEGLYLEPPGDPSINLVTEQCCPRKASALSSYLCIPRQSHFRRKGFKNLSWQGRRKDNLDIPPHICNIINSQGFKISFLPLRPLSSTLA